MADRTKPAMMILRADIDVLMYRGANYHKTVSVVASKLVLLVVAGHEGQRLTLADIAAFAGMSEHHALYTVQALCDRGLLISSDVGRDHPGPNERVHHAGQKRAYEVAWRELSTLPKVRLAGPGGRRYPSKRRTGVSLEATA